MIIWSQSKTVSSRKGESHRPTQEQVASLQSWFMAKNWELFISPVKVNHNYSFSSVSVARLPSIFQLHQISQSTFLRWGKVLLRLDSSLKVNIFENSQQNQLGCFYDMWAWRETSYSYLFRLQLLCPHNSRRADARKFELALFYRPRWWRRKQFMSE